MATQRSPEEYKRAYEHHKSQGNAEAAARVANLYRQYQSTQPKAKDGAFEGYGDAFMRGIDQPLENMGVTAEALGAKGLGESLKGAVDERPGQSASGQFMNADKDGTFAYRYLPKAAVEQAGQFAGSLLARAGGAAVGGAVGNVPGAIAGGLAGPMMFEFAQQLGPIALERAKNNGRETPNKEDWTYATGTSAGVGALNAIAPGATGKIKRMLIEGVTEGTQSVGEQVGSTIDTQKGLEVDPRQAVAEGLIGGTSAGMVDTSVSTAKAAANLVRGNSKSIKNEGDVEAAASFAQRLTTIANANEYDLQDIDKMSTKGARETIDKAHVQYTEELKQKFADLKSRVKVTDQDSLAEVEDKIMTAAAYREGRNKTKNTVGNQEMAALERLTGDTREGQEAMSILRQLNQLTEVHNDGYQGGVSQITDQFAPFGASVGYDKGAVATERLLRPLASGSAAITTGGSSLLAQAAAQGTGRLIDKVTGKRSKVANYIKENSGNQGIPGSNAASLRETNIAAQEAVAAQEEETRLRQEQYTEEERQANLRRVQQGAPPQQGSPEDIMRDATGLDRSGLAQVIRILKANPNTLPATTRAIEAYETSVATGGQVDFGLYRDINALVDQYPQLQNLMVRPRNAQSAAQGQAQQQLSQKDQNYQRGIENNRAEAARITEAVNADSTIPVQQKAMLLNTLEEMQLDLGLNPVSRLQAMARRLEEKGVPGPTVEKYLGQYLQRVMAQQGAKEERDAAQDDAMEIDESMEMSFNRNNVADRKARAKEQGFNQIVYHSTNQNFNQVDPNAVDLGFHVGTSIQADNRSRTLAKEESGYPFDSDEKLRSLGIPQYRDGSNVLKLKMRISGKVLSMPDIGQWDRAELVARALESNKGGAVPNSVQEKAFNINEKIEDYMETDEAFENSTNVFKWRKSSENRKFMEALNQMLRDEGYSTIEYENIMENNYGSNDSSYIVLDPSDVRSVNAQFDPSQTNSLELNASMEPTFTDGPALAFDTSPNVIALMEGSEKPPVMKGKKQVARYLEQRALDRMGGKPRDIKNKQDQMAIAEDMAREAVYEMESSDNPNFEWYDTVIDKTIEMMSVKHPELLSDPKAKTALLVSIAITSQNLAVPENLKYGEEVYSHYAKTGKFLEKKYGSKGGAVLKNLEKANTLLNKLGSMEKMREFLETKFTVRELNPILQEVLGVAKVSGELIDTEVYGSQLFGPKIGNGFYTNLRGDFSPVTIDMWFMRTIGRLRGKLMEFDPAKFAEHSDRLKAAIGRKRISKEALIAEARKIKSQHEKDYKKYRDDYDDGTREKSEAVLAAETMIKGLDGTIDTPGAGKDKKALRDITRMAVARFNELTGLDIPPASFQALIWYPEQDLYSKLGVQLKSLRADYASSTKKILMEEGFNEKDLDTAANRVRQRTQLGTGQVRPSSTENVQEENGQSNLPVSGAIREENQEVDLSTVPGSGALTQPESPQIPFDFTTPTVGQIKDKLEDAKGAVQMVIGKPGTKFEKGLSSYEDYKQLADLLDVSIGVYDSQKDFMRDFPVGEATLGVFGVAKGGVSGQVGLIKGNKEQDFIQTLAHEVSHALESRPQSNQESPLVLGRKLSQRHEQAAADKKSSVYLGSLRSKMRKEIFNETPVKDEIEVLQDGTVVSIAARPDLPGRPIRLNVDNSIETYSAANPDATVAQIFSDVVPQFRQYQSYIKGDAEFAVDPVMYYLINPKAMKKDMPNTFKFIQKHFNESNIPIKLYASPLATIVAILMAGMIGGEEEEEENPGILTPGPGMLSA